jgi:hypothetical protein
MSKTVLVTGGAGFIAHHVIENILRNTDWNVVSLDRLDFSGNLNRLSDMMADFDAELAKEHNETALSPEYQTSLLDYAKKAVVFNDVRLAMSIEVFKEFDTVQAMEASVLKQKRIFRNALPPDDIAFLGQTDGRGGCKTEEDTKRRAKLVGKIHKLFKELSAFCWGAKGFIYLLSFTPMHRILIINFLSIFLFFLWTS